jgi:hypothetical protein
LLPGLKAVTAEHCSFEPWKTSVNRNYPKNARSSLCVVLAGLRDGIILP